MVPIHGCLWYTTTICVVGGRVGGGWKPKEEKQSEREKETENVVAMLVLEGTLVRRVRVRNSVN